ncbi:diaminopimelate decarboxylase family protein [Clostridium septicum]|uniref:Alanine racemase n=1 Tax=Clostridium septicum TaxID=1504 RepID=A0A9N7JKN8_CLOSE|nr:alanine racemase [Clostridium septicum]AYE34105.1 decarboxylase [Clostridium septicum]MDU1313099.1 alanine racemase [Clostridium septicum]QAS59472.1 decarboxylase [Clostridium septicum]UEC21271.1 alanine racemase [Clostridium septicum]USS00685.1 alanine racemase [Clostridium septicum]
MCNNFLKDAISEYKTPFYVFDTDVLVDRIKKIKSVLGSDVELCYAMKANPFLIKSMEKVIDSFEVCSPGEFHICERADVPMDKVIMSGVYKNAEDVEYALLNYGNKVIYTVESLLQWKIIKEYVQKHNLSVRALLRLTIGNQFGMDEEDIRQIISDRDSYPYIEIEGIQFFSGTQKKSAAKMEKELSMLDDFCSVLENCYGFSAKRLEYGPGLPVYYFQEEENCEEEILNALANKISSMNFSGKIVLEVGRFIAASCGTYVTSIVDMKSNKKQNYCIVDGGIHHINYFGQMLAMKKPPIIHWSEQKDGDTKEWTICGSLCTMNDVLVKKYPFVNLQLGDKLIFKMVGAYSVSEGISLFLSRELPQVFLYSKNSGLSLARNNFPTDTLNYIQYKNN